MIAPTDAVAVAAADEADALALLPEALLPAPVPVAAPLAETVN